MKEQFINLRRRRADDGDGSPPSRLAPRQRGVAMSLASGFYKGLVILSALIVAGYIGVQLMMKAPEQKTLPPAQNGTGTYLGPSFGTGAGAGAAVSAGPPKDAPEPLVRRDGVYTVFLAATDAGGALTDTMMLMCYDTVKQTVGVISIPRDTLVARESGNPRLVYGKGGVEGRIEDVSNMLGIPIDGYIKVNIKGFITLVDYLGGVDFYVPCNMNYDDPAQNLSIHYTTGQRKLTGQQAMEVARFRKNNDGSGYSDVGRTQTQQKLLVALAKKVLSWNNLTKINGFVEIFNKNVTTDLTLDNMMYFAGQAINLDSSEGVETATLPGRGDGIYHKVTYCYELDPEETLEIVNRLVNPYDRDMTLKDMNLAKAESYMKS